MGRNTALLRNTYESEEKNCSVLSNCLQEDSTMETKQTASSGIARTIHIQTRLFRHIIILEVY